MIGLPRRALAALGIGAAVLSASLVAAGAWTLLPLPDGLVAPPADASLTITDRHGIPLRGTRAEDGTRVRWVPIERMDPDLLLAFEAVEDRRFRDHGGVDLRAVARATRDNLAARRIVSGASTITMQLARLLHPAERDWTGKAGQTLWAFRLERHLGKQEILEQYLNRVHLGQGAVGVDAAAALYFGASASQLSLGEAATLAGIARAPSRDNPLVSPSRAARRRRSALRRMLAQGVADSAAIARASAEPLLGQRRAAPFLAPHFTTRLLSRAPDGATTIESSLDLVLQEQVEAEVRAVVEGLRDRGARQAAAVVLANATGEILAWVGSPDFWADTAGQTDMVVSPRQPGSALKPFLFGMAFDRGWTPASVLADVPRSFQTSTGPYNPRNYDRRFRGPVLAREALASSYNVPAVELADRLGVIGLLRTLRLAGFESLDRGADHYGLGLALGNGDVTLLELANGYRALANEGQWSPYRWTAAAAGEGAPREPGRRVMSGASAALVLDILADPVARIPGFGVETPFEFPFPVAVKTGTSRHYTDNWAVGTTGGFTVAVWVGDFSGRPMEGVSGVSGAGPLLHRVVLLTAGRVSPGALPSPASQGATRVRICRLSGLGAAHDCPWMDEWLPPGAEPPRADDWHRDGGIALPDEYAEWAASQRATAGPAVTMAARETPPDVPARFRIISPRDGDRYAVPPGVDARYATVALRASGGPGGAVRWEVDGRRVDAARIPLAPGRHVISAAGPGGAVDAVAIEVSAPASLASSP